MRQQSLHKCLNCEHLVNDSYNFCPNCGQKNNEELTIGVLFSNTISNYFSVDARFFKSFLPLMVKPGYLPKKFLEGKRLLYLHPAQMYLFVSVIFFFLFSFVTRKQEQQVDAALKGEMEKAQAVYDTLVEQSKDSSKTRAWLEAYDKNKDKLGMTEQEQKDFDSVVNQVAFLPKSKDLKTKSNWNIIGNDEIVDSMLVAGATDEQIYQALGVKEDDSFLKKRLYNQVLKFHKNKSGGSILKAFYDSLPIAMFILLPFFALILKLLYFKKGRYSHHLVFSFYFFAFLFVVFGFLVAATIIWPNFPGWLTFLIMLSVFFYLMLALRKFYEQGWFLTYIKASVTAFSFGVITFIGMIFLVMIAFMYY